MGKINVQTFIHALNTLHFNVRDSKKYLEDKRLTQSEKKILTSWFLLREEKFVEILEILNSLPMDSNPLVEAQKKLIWGITLNNKGEFTQAVNLILSAQKEQLPFDVNNQHFIAAYNLFIAYLNLKDQKGMEKALDDMTKLDTKNERQQVCVHQSYFNFYSFTGDLKQAGAYLNKLETLTEFMSEPVIITHLIGKYIYTVKLEDWATCSETLNEMKKYRSFNSSSNFIYMKYMLDHYLNDSPLYIYKNKFENCHFLYLQLKVIQGLQEADLAAARTHWSELQAMYPDTYQAEFNYTGDKSIFSLCLQKHLKKATPAKLERPAGETKEECLLLIMQQTDAPIRKELLYELIWGEAPTDKEELHKLKKLISRMRDKGLDVQYKKGCYFIDKTKKEGAA